MTITFKPKIIYKLNNDYVKTCLVKGYASGGLNLWDEFLSTDHKHKIEKYWIDKVHKTHYECEKKKKFYVLSMFPYPSGSLHMGHVRVYTISDSIARYYKLQGKNVVHPMGWDAFGLPAENAAIDRQIDPYTWTQQNILNMREQLFKLGCSFDSSRELTTSDPNYYKWTQELFLKLYDNGLVYQKETFVNWDPVDQTVLADEQVDENDRSWRSGAKVEKILLKQWFIKTTAFAESLMNGLNDPVLKEWRDIIKIQQHWIGKCTGINIDFFTTTENKKYPKILTLWTDKPELIEHAKFVAISNNSLFSRIESSETADPVRKLDVKVINPFTNELIPVFSTKKELLPYPDFREDYLGFPCDTKIDESFCNLVGIQFDSFTFDCEQKQAEKRSSIIKIARDRKIGGYPVSSKLNDWLISRQRFWGTPIPVTYCDNCGCQPVCRDQLPVKLPKLDKSLQKSNSTLKSNREWLSTFCSKCNGPATRETDTMDTFVDSSWYFIRYIDSKNETEMFSCEKSKQYLPVDLYIGGKEHAVLHLYYARFVHHFLHALGLVPTKEPFKQLLVQGMVMGQSFKTNTGKYLKSSQVILESGAYFSKESHEPVTVSWEKMSKSKYNGVNPSEMIEEFGADTVRLVMLSDVAPTSHRKWSKNTFSGIIKWQRRLWQIIRNFIEIRREHNMSRLQNLSSDKEFNDEERYMFDSRNYYVHGVTFNIKGSQQLSIAISKMQGLTNSLKKASNLCIAAGPEYERALAAQVIMLSPFAPHFASELWAGFCSADSRINNNSEILWDKDVLEQIWPKVDMQYALKIRVQVNGKELTKLRLPRQQLDNMSQEDLLQLIKKETKFQEHFINKSILKVFFQSEVGCGASISIITKKNQ